MTERAEVTDNHRVIDFNIHGLISVRLIGASADDVTAVTKHIGALQAPLLDEPDVTLRFVKHHQTAHIRHIGLGRHGFTNDAFFVFEKGLNSAKIRIPFDKIGRSCEIVCESGLQSVPLLMPILGLTALAKGYVPIHASAFVHNGVGILMPGWAHSGKTTALLGFAKLGAEFIGEEWVLVGGNVPTMYGLPTDMELSLTHVNNLLQLHRDISMHWRFKVLSRLDHVHNVIQETNISHNLSTKMLRKMTSILASLATLTVKPQILFANRIRSLVAKPDKLFLLISHVDPQIKVQPAPPSEIARRILFLVQHEQMKFMEHYMAFKFAFPGSTNAFIDNAFQRQHDVLTHALTNADAYIVWHPYPFVFSEFYDKIQPFLEVKQKEWTGPLHEGLINRGQLACKP